MIDRSSGRRAVHIIAVVIVISLLLVVVVSAVPELVGADESYVVLSGSMEPNISVGDSIIVNRVDPATISEGDVVTFHVDGEPHPTTHRVVEVIEDGESYAFLTKGDANEEADPRPVTENELVGRVMVTIPLIGYLYTFLNTPMGYVLFIGVPFGLLVLSELWSITGSSGAEKASQDPPDADTDIERTTTAGSSDEETSGVTLTRRDLQVVLPVTIVFAIYTVWNALQSPGSTVHVGVATLMVLLSLFIGVMYLSLKGSESDTASSSADPTVEIHIEDDLADADGADVTQVASVGELAALARREERPIVADEQLQWYRVQSDGETYLYDEEDVNGSLIETDGQTDQVAENGEVSSAAAGRDR